jgi:hypothetical protein
LWKYENKSNQIKYHCSTGTPDLGVSCAQKPVCKYCNGYLSETASLARPFWKFRVDAKLGLSPELQSARRIIQLLQDDLNGIKNQPPRTELTAPQVSDTPNSWKTIAARTSNPSNQRYSPKNIPNHQKPIPVIKTSNHFHVLHNLQAAQMETSYTFKRTLEIQRSISQTVKKKTVNRVTRIKPLKKITLIGDSICRGWTCNRIAEK